MDRLGQTLQKFQVKAGLKSKPFHPAAYPPVPAAFIDPADNRQCDTGQGPRGWTEIHLPFLSYWTKSYVCLELAHLFKVLEMQTGSMIHV